MSLGPKSTSLPQHILLHACKKLSILKKGLLSLEVAASVVAQMWRTTVLAQALYVCEVREVSHTQLSAAHRFGACAVQDPRLEVAIRRMRWLVTLANHVGAVGTVHRHLATLSGPTWLEPSAALSSTLQELRWMVVVVNSDSMRASRWPNLNPEPS